MSQAIRTGFGHPTTTDNDRDSVASGLVLAQAIVDTVREPLVVLDKALRVVAASRSFYKTFQVTREETLERLLYTLGDGQWNIPELRTLLEQIAPEQGVLEGYEVECTFPRIGRRVMLLNARKVFYNDNNNTTILLAIEDVTQRRASERHMEDLLHQKELLLDEMQHRIINSLQIIASILMLKARSVESLESRLHLEEAHSRVLSIATVQKHLQASGRGEPIAVSPYLSVLCATLAQSIVSSNRPVTVEVIPGPGTVSSNEAVSLGLIVTEAVINALKHAFTPEMKDCRIVVNYVVSGTGWTLAIADNGMGKPTDSRAAKPGLGTSIVNALAHQLEAAVDIESSAAGTIVSIVRTSTTVSEPGLGHP